jgi:pimeloyl-ACP methyl ester carboxylesterase
MGKKSRLSVPANREKMAMRRQSLSVKSGVSAEGEQEFTVAAEIFWPDDSPLSPIMFFCLPGGGMNRHYYDLQTAGDHSFSFAHAMAAQGMITVSVDHVGVGQSSRPADGFLLTPERIAHANANVAGHILGGLQAGTLIADLPALPGLVSIGVGHSMGGLLTTIQQANWPSHQALILLGFSNRGLVNYLPEPAKALIGNPDRIRREIGDVARRIYSTAYPEIAPSAESSALFYGDKADRAGGEALKKARDNLLVVGGLQSMIPGSVTDELARIDVPVFLGLGDNDIAGPPQDIPASLPNCSDITLLVLPDTGHCQFIFASRRQLFERLAGWSRRVAMAQTFPLVKV